MKPDKNKELMLQCGSEKGAYDIEAPGQWKWVLQNGESVERAMAWVKSKTTAFHHESPFCVDEHGKPVYIDQMAAELGWKKQTAVNVLEQLQKQGRIRFEKGRIWYRADVPEVGRREGEQNNCVHSCCPTYVVDFIKKLAPEKRTSALLKLEACSAWRRQFIADGMGSLRSIADRIEDTTLLSIGLPKKRLPERREPKTNGLRLELLEQPDFVQNKQNSVQNPFSYLHKPSGGAQPLLPPTTSPRPQQQPQPKPKTTTTSAAGDPRGADVVVVSEHLGITEKAAARFLSNCPSDCSIAVILACIDQVHATIDQRRVRNPIAIILESVPVKLAAQSRKPPAMEGPRCSTCGELIGDGTAIEGVCANCYQQSQHVAAGD